MNKRHSIKNGGRWSIFGKWTKKPTSNTWVKNPLYNSSENKSQIVYIGNNKNFIETPKIEAIYAKANKTYKKTIKQSGDNNNNFENTNSVVNQIRKEAASGVRPRGHAIKIKKLPTLIKLSRDETNKYLIDYYNSLNINNKHKNVYYLLRINDRNNKTISYLYIENNNIKIEHIEYLNNNEEHQMIFNMKHTQLNIYMSKHMETTHKINVLNVILLKLKNKKLVPY